jgi:hypothetical protein
MAKQNINKYWVYLQIDTQSNCGSSWFNGKTKLGSREPEPTTALLPRTYHYPL